MAMGATTNLCTTIHDLPQIEKPVSAKGIHVHSGPCSASFPKLDDLPDQLITPDVETEVYVSHVNSPDSFFVQLVENEDRIHSLVEQLNVDEPCNDSVDLRTLQEGDVVGAIFPEDESWYRAVIKKVNNNGSVLVEFIDFGNEATIASNQTRCLEKNFLEVPKLCIHCCLRLRSSFFSFPVGNPDRLGAGEGSGLLTSILVCAVNTQKHHFSTDAMSSPAGGLQIKTKNDGSMLSMWGYMPTKFRVPRSFSVPGIIDGNIWNILKSYQMGQKSLSSGSF
ncbi:hypothetical protein AALO_G00246530 [Alosa alosa]|uniref:Tudor domain-containing protein n=1 Tax=Alosa alosa TaxID=278164 RepID=A0AAV6FVM0_9TELE|nr:hypothetical protein AALO_G00246530 [Alosa alosa]